MNLTRLHQTTGQKQQGQQVARNQCTLLRACPCCLAAPLVLSGHGVVAPGGARRPCDAPAAAVCLHSMHGCSMCWRARAHKLAVGYITVLSRCVHSCASIFLILTNTTKPTTRFVALTCRPTHCGHPARPFKNTHSEAAAASNSSTQGPIRSRWRSCSAALAAQHR